MRIYQNFKEAQNEIARDLNELGQDVHPETMQDKEVKDDPDYATKELGNYLYMVLEPDIADIEGVHLDWVEAEWEDRMRGGLNPGTSHKKRPEVWTEFLEGKDKTSKTHIGRFSYTYSERMGGHHIQRIIDELKIHPTSRQLYLPVWTPIDEERRGKRRVPCSLGYWFVYRSNALHVTYMMRSCDFITHYPNDVCLTTLLLEYVAEKANVTPGTLTHYIGSFHVYAKDVAGNF